MASSTFSPVPRVAPAPVSSGVSFRDLPAATLSQIIKTCQHYETKCGGSYSSPADRHLYDLSRDVQDLVRVLKSREDSQSARIRELESVLRDWFDHFGNPDAELQAAGVRRDDESNRPAHVAKRLKQLYRDSSAIETSVQHGKSRSDKELAEMRLALRDAGRIAREQAALEISRVRAEADAAISAERQVRLIAEANLAQARAHYEVDVERKVSEIVMEHNREHARQIQQLKSNLDETSRNHHNQVQELRKQLQHLRDVTEQERAKAADQEAGHAMRAAAAQKSIDDLKAELHALQRSSAVKLEECEDKWYHKFTDTVQQHERSTSTARVRAMEAEIEFLNERVRELQELVQTMQTALHHGAAHLTAAATKGAPSTLRSEGLSLAHDARSSSNDSRMYDATTIHAGSTAATAVSQRIWENTGVGPTPTTTRYAYKVLRSVGGTSI